MVKGTNGYENVVQGFIETTQSILFEDLHKDFLPFIPKGKAHIMDVGAGIGRDAYQLTKMGHQVVAVEPLKEFREAGQKLYNSPDLQWIDDSLPMLKKLSDYPHPFDFVLCSGVWHHLDETEQNQAMHQISRLLKPAGIFALSLRNGPAGAGIHVFAINVHQMLEQAINCNLTPILTLENQPSMIKHKEGVKWARLVLQKKEHL